MELANLKPFRVVSTLEMLSRISISIVNLLSARRLAGEKLRVSVSQSGGRLIFLYIVLVFTLKVLN